MYATYTLKLGDSYRTIIINKFFINSIQCISKVARKIGSQSICAFWRTGCGYMHLRADSDGMGFRIIYLRKRGVHLSTSSSLPTGQGLPGMGLSGSTFRLTHSQSERK